MFPVGVRTDAVMETDQFEEGTRPFLALDDFFRLIHIFFFYSLLRENAFKWQLCIVLLSFDLFIYIICWQVRGDFFTV